MTPQASPFFAIRSAVANDCHAISALADVAFALYLPRMQTKPAPMLEDYAQRIAEGTVFVLDVKGALAGFLLLLPEATGLMLDTVAVDPSHQGKGFGKLLVLFAEKKAREAGYARLALYTNEAMPENLTLYTHLGFTETHRAIQNGYRRIFMEKNTTL